MSGGLLSGGASVGRRAQRGHLAFGRWRIPVRRPAAWTVGLAAASYWTAMSPFSQLLGPFPYRGRTTERVVALTFDDGPNDPYTSRIAELLAVSGVCATFFAVGRCVERHPETARRLLRDGHVLGSHGYSHDLRRCAGRRVLRDEVWRAEEVFAEHLGVRPTLFRPPWLLRTPALFDVAREQSLQLVSGEFAHVLEVRQPSPERIARRAVAKVRPGSILIFHDGFDAKGGERASTVAATELVVTKLSAQGYRFTTVDRLLGVPPYQDAAQCPGVHGGGASRRRCERAGSGSGAPGAR
ncbi:MAG: polysaccharide deacetylase family protein [Actinomycetota bacterium]|nr:polysaccharide deacetylase family protein [Actinomycetota bacterium]